MKKNMVIITAMLLVVSGLLLGEDVAPESGSEVVLAIHVVNGTQGGSVPEGTPVTVECYQFNELIHQGSAVTDVAGNCEITGIPAGSDIVTVAQAKHSDMAFSSAPLPLDKKQDHYDLSLQVFDVTYDNSMIRGGTHHLIIKKKGNHIHVTEYLQMVNDSDKAILSDIKDEQGHSRVVEVALPENYQQLTFSSYFHPDAVVLTPTGFYDTMAIPPGSYHGVFLYDVPMTSETMEFVKNITLSTDSMMVFVQTNDLTVDGLGDPVGQMSLKDGTTANYYIVDVSKSPVVRFQIEGTFTEKPRDNTWTVLGIVFLVVVAIGLFRAIKVKHKG